MKRKYIMTIYIMLILSVTLLNGCTSTKPNDSEYIEKSEKISDIPDDTDVSEYRGVSEESDIQNIEVNIDLADTSQLTYMVYYGELTDDIIETAKQYDVVILHPKVGNITREQVRE